MGRFTQGALLSRRCSRCCRRRHRVYMGVSGAAPCCCQLLLWRGSSGLRHVRVRWSTGQTPELTTGPCGGLLRGTTLLGLLGRTVLRVKLRLSLLLFLKLLKLLGCLRNCLLNLRKQGKNTSVCEIYFA